MAELSTREKAETVRARILADRIARGAQWSLFVAIVCGLAAPLAIEAWRERGALACLVTFALCVGLAWQVKPHGRSYAAQAREIDRAVYPRE